MIRSFLSLLVLLSPGLLSIGCSLPGASPATDSSGALDPVWLRKQLVQSQADSDNMDRRRYAMGSHFLAPRCLWVAVFPVQHADGKVIAQGRRIVEPLLRIASDSSEADSVRGAARGILIMSSNDPRILQLALDDVHTDPARALRGWLPSPNGGNARDADETFIWLRDQVRTKPCEEIVLGLMDRKMVDDMRPRARLTSDDFDVLRWLNRRFDRDVDEMLAEKAPAALAFRQRERAKGYDPLSALYLVFNESQAQGALSEGVNAIYKDRQDRKACLQLFETMLNRDFPIVEPPGWGDRLRTWYWANRHSFVYDAKSLHFITSGTDLK